MTVLRTVRAAEPTVVFSPQRKYKTVGSNPASATKIAILFKSGFYFCCYRPRGMSPRANNSKGEAVVNDSPADCQSRRADRSIFSAEKIQDRAVQIQPPQPKPFPNAVREGFTFSLFTFHSSLSWSENVFWK